MKKGFTLIEFLIYLALVGLVVTSLVLWVLSLTGARDKNYAVSEIQANSQAILSTLGEALRAATAVISPLPGETGGVLELSRAGAVWRFAVAGGVLTLTVDAAPALNLSSRLTEVTALSFTNLTPPLAARANVRVSLALRYRAAATTDFTYEAETATAFSLRQ